MPRSVRAGLGPLVRRPWLPVVVAVVLLLGACAAEGPAPTPAQRASPIASATAPVSHAPAAGAVRPAPGSDSAVYPPNPGAIVVAVDAGHGGCLDWGVPDPSERGVEFSEKVMALGIARRLRDRLEAEGVGVVMIRDGDEALAGDDYPPLDCHGPPWRDVNGDGLAGFGPDVPEATRTRDELQARLDLANLAGADALVSIHINSPFDDGQVIETAFTETFYTDETPWGATSTARLAAAIQAGVVEALEPLATYERGDRGITAHNLYIVAPPLFEVTPERDDPRRQPTRGGLMPAVLIEAGSITLRAEHDLLASAEGQAAVAAGLLDGLAVFFGARDLAGRIGLADVPADEEPRAVEGDGPPFWAPVAPDGAIGLRLTNTGTRAWPEGIELVAGWEETDEPYLARPPASVEPLDVDVPPLAPGESVVVTVELPAGPSERGVAWISLRDGSATLADRGSPALQLSNRAP